MQLFRDISLCSSLFSLFLYSISSQQRLKGHPLLWIIPSKVCSKCNAIVWKEEKVNGKKKLESYYTTCCKNGKIILPHFRRAPKRLRRLLNPSNLDAHSRRFREHIRSFNSMFCMTSHGAKIDYNVMRGKGPYTFRMHGQNYHAIRSLIPEPPNKPRYAQLCIYDTANEIENRYRSLNRTSLPSEAMEIMDKEIIVDVKLELDSVNGYVQEFRKERDFHEMNQTAEFALRLIENRNRGLSNYNRPQADDIAVLMLGDEFEENKGRDIIIKHKKKGFQRITELHPSYMPLQYPLLFPYGEDGWHMGLQNHNLNGKNRKRKKMSMKDYYAYRLQQRTTEATTLLQGGRLLQQFIVDAYAAVEEECLCWIRNNQRTLRAELYKGLCDALEAGDSNTA
ncbi:uncharacterized protein A4U43_C04F4350 [Asparagus officinalis]|uniref:Helitron helicase-like domain-containing protein n=1 Tax=Asparagus officinalis TaxID=4686 RepID=A0A5P1EYA2_ASPOF|nr:uncharacterized protein A4U43_C04F4350 [Asparagus officinalis]